MSILNYAKLLNRLKFKKFIPSVISCKPSCSICEYLSFDRDFVCSKRNLRLSESAILRSCKCSQFQLRKSLS